MAVLSFYESRLIHCQENVISVIYELLNNGEGFYER
jgi:hypothetical protein